MDFVQRVWEAVPGEDMPGKVWFISAFLGVFAFLTFSDRLSKKFHRDKPKNAEAGDRKRLKRIAEILIGRAKAQSAFLPGGDQPGAKQAEAIIEKDIGVAIVTLVTAGKIEAAEAAERGDTKVADDALAAMIAIIEPASLGAAKEEAKLYRQRGGLAYTDDTQAALHFYAKAAELDPKDIEGLFALAQLRIRAGHRLASRQDPERLITLENWIEDKRERQYSGFPLADAEAALEDSNGASGLHEPAQAFVHDLIQYNPNNAEERLEISVCDDRAGEIDTVRADRDGVLEAHSDALEIAKRLAACDPDNAEWQRDLLESYNLIGDISAGSGDWDSALKAYLEGLEIAKQLAARDPSNATWLHDLSVSYSKIGDISAARGDQDEALKAYADSLEIAKTLSQRDRSNVIWQTHLAVSAWKLAAAGADDWPMHLSDGLAILNRLDAERKLSADQKEWIPMFEAALRQAEEPAH